RTTTSYREIGNAFLVWLRLCCSAGQNLVDLERWNRLPEEVRRELGVVGSLVSVGRRRHQVLDSDRDRIEPAYRNNIARKRIGADLAVRKRGAGGGIVDSSIHNGGPGIRVGADLIADENLSPTEVSAAHG